MNAPSGKTGSQSVRRISTAGRRALHSEDDLTAPSGLPTDRNRSVPAVLPRQSYEKKTESGLPAHGRKAASGYRNADRRDLARTGPVPRLVLPGSAARRRKSCDTYASLAWQRLQEACQGLTVQRRAAKSGRVGRSLAALCGNSECPAPFRTDAVQESRKAARFGAQRVGPESA